MAMLGRTHIGLFLGDLCVWPKSPSALVTVRADVFSTRCQGDTGTAGWFYIHYRYASLIVLTVNVVVPFSSLGRQGRKRLIHQDHRLA